MVMKFTMETNHTIEEDGKSSKAPGPGQSFGMGMAKCIETYPAEFFKPFLIPAWLLRSACLGYDAVFWHFGGTRCLHLQSRN